MPHPNQNPSPAPQQTTTAKSFASVLAGAGLPVLTGAYGLQSVAITDATATALANAGESFGSAYAQVRVYVPRVWGEEAGLGTPAASLSSCTPSTLPHPSRPATMHQGNKALVVINADQKSQVVGEEGN